MKKTTLVLVSFLALSFFSQSIESYAETTSDSSSEQELLVSGLEGLSVAPDRLARGAYKPTANKNITSGKYNMSGSYRGKYYLYSNYNCYGKNTYNYYFHNQGSGTLEVRMRNAANGATLKVHFLKPGQTLSSSLKMNSSKSKFYYEFYSTTDYVFSGYVK